MSTIKERCLWFIGANRLQGSIFSDFMYSDCGDVVLFNYTDDFDIKNTDKRMIVGISYTVAKQKLKEM